MLRKYKKICTLNRNRETKQQTASNISEKLQNYFFNNLISCVTFMGTFFGIVSVGFYMLDNDVPMVFSSLSSFDLFFVLIIYGMFAAVLISFVVVESSLFYFYKKFGDISSLMIMFVCFFIHVGIVLYLICYAFLAYKQVFLFFCVLIVLGFIFFLLYLFQSFKEYFTVCIMSYALASFMLIPKINKGIFGGKFDIVIKKEFYTALPFTKGCQLQENDNFCIIKDANVLWNYGELLVLKEDATNFYINKSDVIALTRVNSK